MKRTRLGCVKLAVAVHPSLLQRTPRTLTIVKRKCPGWIATDAPLDVSIRRRQRHELALTLVRRSLPAKRANAFGCRFLTATASA